MSADFDRMFRDTVEEQRRQMRGNPVPWVVPDMTDTKLPSAPGDIAKKLAPLLGFLGTAVSYSSVTTVRQARAALTHPSKAARLALLAGLVADGVIAAYLVGKAKGVEKHETPEQKAKRLDTVPPLSYVRLALGARDGVAMGLAASQRHGVGRSIATGVGAYAVNVAFQLTARALAPRMRELSKALKAETEALKR